MGLEWNAPVFRILLDSSVRIVAVAAAVSGILFLSRIRSSSVRHRAWTAVLAVMLAMPLLVSIAPPIGLPYYTTIQTDNPVFGNVGTDAPPASPTSTDHVSPASTVAPRSSMPPANTVPPLQERFRWPVLLMAIYGVGVAALLARLLWGWRAMNRLIRSSHVASGAVGAAFLESDAVSTPLTCGVVRSRIVLPRSWREWPETKLLAVLAHERAHVKRRDALVGFLARVNCAVFWFHPLTWWLERKIAMLAEHACDDAVVRETGEPERYAAALVEIADSVRRRGERYSWQGIGVYGKGMLRNRIDRLLSGVIPQDVSLARKVLVGVLCGVSICLAVAGRPEAHAQRAAIDSSSPSQRLEWVTYRDGERHFSFQHPTTWRINDEPHLPHEGSTNIAGMFNRYHSAYVSLNSMGKEHFDFKQVQKSRDDWEFDTPEIIQQLPPGAVYIDVGQVFAHGPDRFGTEVKEMEEADLSGFLKEPNKPSTGEMTERYFGFSKRGKQWLITVYVRAPYSQAQQENVDQILASFRFDPVPAGESQDQPLRLTIKSDKNVYLEGEPIDLVAMLSNSGKAAARIYSPEYGGVSEIVVEDSKGVRVSPRGIKVERTGFATFMVIPPGEARSQKFENLRWYHCGGAWEFAGNSRLAPGTYTIYLIVTNPPAYTCGEDPSNPRKPLEKTDLAGTLTSNKISLRIEAQAQTKPEIAVTISAPEVVPTADVPVTVRFRSATDGSVRLLNEFDPQMTPLSYFFGVRVIASDGTTVLWPIRPMVSFSSRPFKYVEVTKEKSFEVVLHLEEMFQGTFTPDNYTIELTYSNDAGTDCFKGSVHSEPIKIRVRSDETPLEIERANALRGKRLEKLERKP